MPENSHKNTQFSVRALSEDSIRSLVRENADLLSRLFDSVVGSLNPDLKFSQLLAVEVMRNPALINSFIAHATGGTIEDTANVGFLAKILIFTKCINLTKVAHSSDTLQQILFDELVAPQATLLEGSVH